MAHRSLSHTGLPTLDGALHFTCHPQNRNLPQMSKKKRRIQTEETVLLIMLRAQLFFLQVEKVKPCFGGNECKKKKKKTAGKREKRNVCFLHKHTDCREPTRSRLHWRTPIMPEAMSTEAMTERTSSCLQCSHSSHRGQQLQYQYSAHRGKQLQL